MLFASATVALAVGVAATRRVVTAAFLLFATLFGVAALYVFAAADFLATIQLIVYVGGILVLLLFGVMLSHRLTLGSDARALPRTQLTQVPLALLASGMVMALIGWAAWSWLSTQALVPGTPDARIPVFGVQLLTEWLLPFELASVLLLAALVGAAYLARRSPAQPRDVKAQPNTASESTEPFLP